MLHMRPCAACPDMLHSRGLHAFGSACPLRENDRTACAPPPTPTHPLTLHHNTTNQLTRSPQPPNTHTPHPHPRAPAAPSPRSCRWGWGPARPAAPAARFPEGRRCAPGPGGTCRQTCSCRFLLVQCIWLMLTAPACSTQKTRNSEARCGAKTCGLAVLLAVGATPACMHGLAAPEISVPAAHCCCCCVARNSLLARVHHGARARPGEQLEIGPQLAGCQGPKRLQRVLHCRALGAVGGPNVAQPAR